MSPVPKACKVICPLSKIKFLLLNITIYIKKIMLKILSSTFDYFVSLAPIGVET